MKCVYCKQERNIDCFRRAGRKKIYDWCSGCKGAHRAASHKEYERRIANSPEYRNRKKKWREENRGLRAAYNAKRRAAERNATPCWVDSKEIESKYVEARRRTKVSGIQYDVDHIIPLNSPIVCGLHVEYNLRVITATANNRKGNTFVQ